MATLLGPKWHANGSLCTKLAFAQFLDVSIVSCSASEKTTFCGSLDQRLPGLDQATSVTVAAEGPRLLFVGVEPRPGLWALVKHPPEAASFALDQAECQPVCDSCSSTAKLAISERTTLSAATKLA